MTEIDNNYFEQDTCCICLEELNKFPILSLQECKHTFHSDCALKWLD